MYHVSCLHAHQQNGSAERKHRHIVEVGLALLAAASMPLKFWDEAFLTATYLINIRPSKVIKFENPITRLLVLLQTTHLFVFLAVHVGQILGHTIHASLLFVPKNVFFWGIVLSTKESSV